MKRTYLKFNQKAYNLPTIKSRRMRLGLSRANVAYKTDGPAPDDTPAEFKEAADDTDEVKSIKTIGRQVHSFKKALGEKASAEEFKTISDKIDGLAKNIATMESAGITQAIKDINEGNEKIWKQIAEMQEKNLEEKEKGESSGKPKPLISTKDVQDFVKATFGEDKTKTSNEAKIEIVTNKAAENFGMANFYEGGPNTDESAFTGRFIDPTLYQRRRKTNIILDYFNIQTITVPELVFLVKVEDGDDPDSISGDSGSAEWILSGAEKPKRSFRVTTGSAKAKKVAIFGTVEDCLAMDVPSLERWLREDFMDEMREEINDGLLNNNPAVNPEAPLGLKTDATQFSATPGYANKFTAASTNYIDQLIATFATMRYRREEAAIAFVSSDVWYQIQHLKGTDGHYQQNNLVYTNTLGQLFIAGVMIVPVDQDDVPSTHVLIIGKELGFKIYAYGNMVFERGLNADDFRHDRTSYRSYQRFLSFLPTHRENSVMYDTWANIQAAIEA